MSNNLFDKLNVLLRSKVGGLLDGKLPSVRRGSQDDVQTLRKRINEAVDYEKQLQQQIKALIAEREDLDRRADDAVQKNNEAMAKHFIARIQRLDQRIEMMQAELRSHEQVAQELIDSVNRLDAAVADNTYASQTDEPQQVEQNPAKTFATQATDRFQQVFHNAQQKITDLSDKIKSRQDESRTILEDADDLPNEVDQAKIDDDLAARRNRLSR
ncbi:MAG: hypothetical protein Kow00117_22180 [Phototrophicales bacterium]|nr:MAG: hypothetical protein CUN56_09565 [Phototrophicales bacterium]RMG72259.1 MAG: hypothetical protein D6711_13365 [Chloroflexota bacterium]